MASILPDGVGTPYVALFNGSGQPLIDRVSGIPLSVFATSFNFEQKEGETKEVEITLKVPNGSIIDSREIGPYSPIKVKWGWIYPDGTYTYGPLWNLMVTGREISFTPQAIDISLKLSDRTILYKNAPSEFPDNFATNIELLKKLLVGKEAVFTVLVDYKGSHTEVTKGFVFNQKNEDNTEQQ